MDTRNQYGQDLAQFYFSRKHPQRAVTFNSIHIMNLTWCSSIEDEKVEHGGKHSKQLKEKINKNLNLHHMQVEIPDPSVGANVALLFSVLATLPSLFFQVLRDHQS